MLELQATLPSRQWKDQEYPQGAADPFRGTWRFSDLAMYGYPTV